MKSIDEPEIERKKINIEYTNKTEEEIEVEAQKLVERVCQAKDICYSSDAHYTFFRNHTQLTQLPTIHTLPKARDDLNKQLPQIFKNAYVVYFNAEDKIKWILSKKIKKMELKNNSIKICIRGDKTDCGRNQSFFNSCFSLPDEGKIAKTANGQYTLGVFEVQSDNYETMNVALKDIVDKTRSLNNKITIENKDYNIEWYLSGDMVWHKTERGLNSCASNHPCFKCRFNKKDFSENNYDKNKSDKENKMRTLDESKEFLNKKEKEKEGYLHPPIFDFIPFKNVVHDTMHESINIPKVAMNLTHKELIRIDDSKTSDLNKLHAQKQLIDWFKSIGMKNPYKLKGQNSKESDPKVMLRSFTGSQFKKFRNF